MQPYTKAYYMTRREGARRSAREIVPFVMGLVQPKSVIDVGCGVGTWLSVFMQYGVEDMLGIDGEYVDRQMLEIPEANFMPFDLRKPLRIDREYDLAVSLEVAEHLPEQHAQQFVDSLSRLAPVILFSAAIPFQGGTDHVNEQWPDYWVSQFRQKGFVGLDCIRWRVWRNENVEWWYAQNAFLVVREEHLNRCPPLSMEHRYPSCDPLAVVHPMKYLKAVAAADPRNSSLRKVLAALPFLAKNSVKRRVERVFGTRGVGSSRAARGP